MLATNKTKLRFSRFLISKRQKTNVVLTMRDVILRCHNKASIFISIDVFVIHDGTNIREAHYNWFRFGKNPN
jgi:hypothetical protein